MNIHRRLARLEKAALPTDTGKHIALAPEKRRERIGELVSKMAPEEMTAFEFKHNLHSGTLNKYVADPKLAA